MEGPNNRLAQSYIPPAIATDSYQTPPPDPPIELLSDPPLLQSPTSSPEQSQLPTPSSHTPHSPLLAHTPINPLPHTPITPHSPLTPLTSQSTLASEASVDSGVASAHSLDLLHNTSSSSIDAHALRRRAGSSVSSGTSEVGLSSLDGEPAGLEVLQELWPQSESSSALRRSPTMLTQDHIPFQNNQPASTFDSSSSSTPNPPLGSSPPLNCQIHPNYPSTMITTAATNTTMTVTTITTPMVFHNSPIKERHYSSSEQYLNMSKATETECIAIVSSPTTLGVENTSCQGSSYSSSTCLSSISSHLGEKDHHPKEAFSSVIPFHPSALKSSQHLTGPLCSNNEQDSKNQPTKKAITDSCASSRFGLRDEKNVFQNSIEIFEAKKEESKVVNDCDQYVTTTYSSVNSSSEEKNQKIPKAKVNEKGSTFGRSSSDVERMAREGCVWIDKFACLFVKQILEEALMVSCSLGWSIKCSGQCQREQCREDYQKKESCRWMGGTLKANRKASIPLLGLTCGSPGLCWTPELPYSPSHRPHSRSSLGSSLSFSHDSLVSSGPRMDDSHLITGAVSHDALLFPTSKTPLSDVSDIYNVPVDGDIYAVPIDVIKPNDGQIVHPKAIMLQPKKRHHHHHHHRRHKHTATSISAASLLNDGGFKKFISSHDQGNKKDNSMSRSRQHSGQSGASLSSGDVRVSKRHSVPSNIGCASSMTPKHGIGNKEGREPIHMTLEEVRKSFHESDDTINCNKNNRIEQEVTGTTDQSKICRIIPFTSMKSCKRKEISSDTRLDDHRKKSRSISSNIRNTLITIFGFRKATKSSNTRLKNGTCIPTTTTATQGFSDTAASNGVGTITTTSSNSLVVNNNSVLNTTITAKNHHNYHNNHHRPSNGINTGLLSCLGNHRTEPDDDDDILITPVSSPLSNSINSSRSPAVVTNRALPPLPLQTDDTGGGECLSQASNTTVVSTESSTTITNSSSTTTTTTSSESSTAHQGGPVTDRREEEGCDFASIIEKVKDCGWYWGPISGEAAEKVLANEPDGSFIVRDSSDHHYIFSLTFKLNGFIRHVRIEHDQGNFSFGGFTKFKSQTIVEFIENAVEHSRSGRYLFFLHRRPVLGPMRVQLLHPVSRFKHIQSLQHLCRFVIVKHVRRDLIGELPLPQRLKDYLCSPHYYSERVEQCMAAAAAAAAAAAITASTVSVDVEEEKSASSAEQVGNEHSIPDHNQGLEPPPSSSSSSCVEQPAEDSILVSSSLPCNDVAVGFHGIPQPVMDRASQTSQATSPNPSNYHHCTAHFESPIKDKNDGNEYDTHQNCNHHQGMILQENSVTSNSVSVPPALQGLEHEFRQIAQSLSKFNHQQDGHSSNIITTITPFTEDTASDEPATTANHSSLICCSPAHAECDIYPTCPRVTTLTSQALTAASASSPAALQGNLAFAHEHIMTDASGSLDKSLNSSTSDDIVCDAYDSETTCFIKTPAIPPLSQNIKHDVDDDDYTINVTGENFTTTTTNPAAATAIISTTNSTTTTTTNTITTTTTSTSTSTSTTTPPPPPSPTITTIITIPISVTNYISKSITTTTSNSTFSPITTISSSHNVNRTTAGEVGAVSSREFFEVNPCRGLDDQVFEDLGGV